ncbi:MAG: hypothetical protein QM739_05155 [Propionivibrio sp.]
MPHRHDTANTTQQKALIASTAARLIAESGISDYSLAKRKALHTLGLPDGTPLPENAEVETELRTYQRLFQGGEHAERIDRLRRRACEIMELVQKFNPYLTGSVLDGTAGRYAEIDIQLFTDSAKDVEIFLLNQRIDFAHSTPRSDRAEAVLTLNDDVAAINLIVYPRFEERIVLKTRDGRVRQRVRLDALKKMLSEVSPFPMDDRAVLPTP